MTHFESIISKKTVDELMEYIEDFDRYSTDALNAVIEELRKRGKNFSEEELQLLQKRIEKKEEIEEEETTPFGSTIYEGKYVVTDPNAPLLYSKFAIWIFTVLVNPLFGAILLALNVTNKVNRIKIIGLGLTLTIILLLIRDHFPIIGFGLFINMVVGWFLTKDTWNRYIGREVRYRAKPIWIPLIVTLIIIAFYVLVYIYGLENTAYN